MADIVDLAQSQETSITSAEIDRIRANAEMAEGNPGECEYCGEWSERLVKKACARCRDKYKLG